MWKRKEWVINNLFPREIIFMYFYVIWIIIGSDNRVKVQFLSELCVYTTKNNIILTRYYYVLTLEDMDLFLEIDRHLFARITSSLMWYSKLSLDLYIYIWERLIIRSTMQRTSLTFFSSKAFSPLSVFNHDIWNSTAATLRLFL